MSRITIAQLEAFYWTATLGSVDAAAKKLNMSQPTISLRLKTLEAEAGVVLFNRIGRGLRLSTEGHDLLPDARSVLDSVDNISSHTRQTRVGGPIRVGFAEGFALVCLSPILERLHSLYPELVPELVVATTSNVEPELHDHKLDLAFLVNPTENDDFSFVPLGAQETSWIAATSWDLPETVTPHDLAGLPIISNPSGSINYRQVRGWFASAGISPRRLDVCNSVAMLAHLVTTGVAIGIYPSKMADHNVKQGDVRLLRTSPPVADTPIFAKYPSRKQTPNTMAFIATARSVLSQMDYLKEK